MRSLLCITGLLAASVAYGETMVTVDVLDAAAAKPRFKFENVPAPSPTDAGNLATLTLVDGRRDPSSPAIGTLTDGATSDSPDDPAHSFFFGGDGGRVLVDLGKELDIEQVSSYSWHPSDRAPQVYTLWGAAEDAQGLNLALSDAEPAESGWTKIADVDTREAADGKRGQTGVSIDGVGKFRYLLFDIQKSDERSPYGNTFFTEIDIVDGNEYAKAEPPSNVDSMEIDGKYEIFFDTTGAPELRGWVNEELKPVVRAWYPKIVKMLPSEGFDAPTKFTIYFRNSMDGIAHTEGVNVYCGGVWFSRNLDGEAKGAVVHELVHVVQQYNSPRNPVWLYEGLCDYIRWFKYEPADQRPRVNFAKDNYNGSYKITASFLNYLVSQKGEEIIPKLNAIMREDRYNDDVWKELTGKTAAELWADFEESSKKS
ncbi:basic secretory protein-like protein [Aeoliella sp. SH292]|uniref:basic secretory protein-like protein n=1 Tax=Aeoliella sp. SH292 TaxID=3454464 RepID=UPI003F95DAED